MADIQSTSNVAAALIQGTFNLITHAMTLKAQEKQAEKQREFEAEQEKKRREFEKELEGIKFENQAELQRRRFEFEKQLEWEKAVFYRNTQLEVAAEQRKTALDTVERQKLYENWPLKLVPSQIIEVPSENIEGYSGSGPVPLRIIPVPPVLDSDKRNSDQHQLIAEYFPNIEKSLAGELRRFLDKYYPLNDPYRPAELLDRAWESGDNRGGFSIKGLFSVLKSEPILILESEVDGDYLDFRLAFWDLGQDNYSYNPVISRLPYRDMVYKSVANRTIKWKEQRDLHLSQGMALEEFEALASDNEPGIVDNIKTLEKIERCRQLGWDTKKLERKYRVSEEDWEGVRQLLVTCHCLVAAWVADIHHLIQGDVRPLLPQLLPQLAEDARNLEVVREIVSGYRGVYEVLERQRPSWVPELALELADSLKYLPDKSWAREQVKYSLQSWLRVRGVTPPEEMEKAISAMKSVMSLQDEEYCTALQECLREVEERLAASQVKGLLNEYTAVEDGCQQAMALWKAGQLQEAMWVLDSAIQRYPDYPKIHQLRHQLQEEIDTEAECDRRVMDCLQSAQLQEALQILDSAIKRYPDNSKILKLRQQLPAKAQVFQFETVTVNRRGEIIKREKKSAQSYIEDLGNGVTLEMVAIVGGKFIMGSPENEESRQYFEDPQHEVTVPTFFMGKFKVTQNQWKVVASYPKVDRDLNSWPSCFNTKRDGRPRPVEQISWYDAVEFCKRLSKETGREYRFPSEAEWEYACRAGTSTPFYFGETITPDLVNYNGNCPYAGAPEGTYWRGTTADGQFKFPPNAFGLYDMHGNLWEWCADTWHTVYEGAPTDGSAWSSEKTKLKVLRGGSWIDYACTCRSASRSNNNPHIVNDKTGFRVVCSASRNP
jgi:formylglycine-generating enzyme required for sulfatase activity